MKAKKLILIVVLLPTVSTVVFGDRKLDRTEILQIFQTLTSQPRDTWILAGTIETKHRAYKSSHGYVIDSSVIVKYDGERFYWEINIDSYTKQTEPKQGGEDLDLLVNTRRIFAWDGWRYTMYFGPGNHAIVTESPSNISVVVNGPLTAGIVPWGYGIYTLEELSIAESSAVLDDQGQIHLTLNKTNMPEIVFVLEADPVKNYPVLSCSINNPSRSSTVKTYGDYELVSGKWVPTSILIERYDNSKRTPELLTQDYWDINSISLTPPSPDSFDVAYETDTLVEYHSPVTDRPLLYRHSNQIDTNSLLQDRLAIVSAHDTESQNCATVAMKYVLAQSGRSITDQELAPLVNEPNEDTSFYELRQFAQQLGFYCLAVKTDIQTLRDLKNCQAILHIPGANHYVVLGAVDDEYVWAIDLDSNKFYYRTELEEFRLRWRDGTALLLCNEPLDLEGNLTELNDEDLRKIIGSTISFDNFACTELIQQYDVIFCSEPILGLCGSRYRVFYNRFGCAGGEEGDYCTGTGMVGNVSSPCVEDMDNPGTCNITGEWYGQYMRACQ